MTQLKDTVVIGYSRGLLCLHAFDKGGMLVLWNPSVKRSVGILPVGQLSVFGFAVCPVTNEPTIVGISFPWKVQIFTLSSKKWSEIQCRKPRESFAPLMLPQVVIGSCIFRLAHEKTVLPNGHVTLQLMIVSFDLVAQQFSVIDLPDHITNPSTRLTLSKLNGSLVVIVPHSEVKVWKMEPDSSFTLLFTVASTPASSITSIVGFRKNGQLVFKIKTGMESRKNGLCLIITIPAIVKSMIMLLKFMIRAHAASMILGFLDKMVHSSSALSRKHFIC